MVFYEQLYYFAEEKPELLKAYLLLALATELAIPKTLQRLHQDLWYDEIDMVKQYIENASDEGEFARLQKRLDAYERICKTIWEINPDYTRPV
jgi:hypothetical protein